MSASAEGRVAAPWRVAGDHLLLHIRATPRAGRDGFEGVETQADGKSVLRVRLKAAPVDGGANDALRRLIRSQLGLKLNQIEIVSGETSRTKTVRLPLSALEALAAMTGG
ncbi:MAG: hypothetical protein BGP06_20795 [Rhizobiales bacterium 65-9]|nr:DUF167 domain-containing protein [Hyphomicrobiales bacterium]OJY36467.1 MAG: hypothetical protein BGP06_20795 [Rhizobiales bacterium 65-9]